MRNHLKSSHKRYYRSSDNSVMEFMCRVCNTREDSLEELEEHANTHTEQLFTSSYKKREFNSFRSDKDRSRSPRSRLKPERSRSPRSRPKPERPFGWEKVKSSEGKKINIKI